MLGQGPWALEYSYAAWSMVPIKKTSIPRESLTFLFTLLEDEFKKMQEKCVNALIAKLSAYLNYVFFGIKIIDMLFYRHAIHGDCFKAIIHFR